MTVPVSRRAIVAAVAGIAVWMPVVGSAGPPSTGSRTQSGSLGVARAAPSGWVMTGLGHYWAQDINERGGVTHPALPVEFVGSGRGKPAQRHPRLERLSKCLLECSEADQAAGDRDECFVDVGSAFVAEPQSAVLVEPGERALDDPALAAQPGAVCGSLLRDDGLDPSCSQPRLGRLRLVATVAQQRAGSSPRPATLAAHGRDCLDEGDQLGDVVAVGGGRQAGERDPARIGDQVMLGAALAPVDWARAGFGAPKTAGI
jgi:hypothetical protein